MSFTTDEDELILEEHTGDVIVSMHPLTQEVYISIQQPDESSAGEGTLTRANALLLLQWLRRKLK